MSTMSSRGPLVGESGSTREVSVHCTVTLPTAKLPVRAGSRPSAASEDWAIVHVAVAAIATMSVRTERSILSTGRPRPTSMCVLRPSGVLPREVSSICIEVWKAALVSMLNFVWTH